MISIMEQQKDMFYGLILTAVDSADDCGVCILTGNPKDNGSILAAGDRMFLNLKPAVENCGSSGAPGGRFITSAVGVQRRHRQRHH